MQRRRFTSTAICLATTVFASLSAGCDNVTKPNIRKLEKTYDYLVDPELRRKEIGDTLLIVRNVELSGTQFHGIDWRNVRFVGCDFEGAYELKLAPTVNCVLEDCRFVGIHSFGTMRNVHFLRCQAAGETFLSGKRESANVLFEDCTFTGSSADINHWGDVGTYGEAEFVRCKAKWFGISGDTKLTIRNCEFESVESRSDSSEIEGIYSTVVIEKSKLRGLFKMVSADLQSLTIRDTVLDNLDLSGATVKGDVVIERVRGGCINAYVKEARSLSVRHSQIYGSGQKIFEAYAGGIRSIEIDTVIFGGDFSTEPVSIAGGTGADSSNVRARVNDSIVIRKSKVPRLSTHHVNTASYRLESCEIDSLDLSSSRIGVLELIGNTIARNVDFTGTQVMNSKVQALAKGQAKIDGSNVKIN